ncbi:hypothetical protein HWC53_gp101 [Bacillus phage vB_BmeM-Goe8]|uniref:Uncharacterized protein n=1 Tax=Bacillus phage vB_BmeM-Goe8 TaxID=2593638 RepID=A0A516KN08_9CAUD|nr:hypothetical protein HWC53_gp101 [Bacillus phage vB_BmeM-Goe8]QDP42988.1 hypothetical protein Goe8_c02150 [Bacillus phage vB_BmeM-Goe8]
MKKGVNVYRYSCADIEVTEAGFFLAKDDTDAAERIKKIALTDECLEYKKVMSEDELAQLLINGSVQTFYEDWDD